MILPVTTTPVRSGVMVRLVLTALLPVLAATVVLLTPAAAAPRTCFWAVPDDPNAVNVAYPDTGASYWGGLAKVPPGGSLEITGEYPHARYFSFTAYDPAARPMDALADVEVVPDEGSSNPFQPGADRTVENRSYTLRAVPGVRPGGGGGDPNTLYIGAGGTGTPAGIVIYRIYVIDDGRDATGDAGLPEVTLVAPDGTRQPLTDACSAAGVDTPPTLHDAMTDAEGTTIDGASLPNATDPVTWEKFFNVIHAQSQRLDNTPLEALQTTAPADESGGYLSNVHNAYVFTTTDSGHGSVLMLQGRSPSFPRTRAGAATTPTDVDVRYWSLCQNENSSTRYVDCVYDEDVLLDADGRYTIAISTPDDRPANATAECGVNWLPWGPTQQGLPILRHMLPSLDFAESIQQAGENPAETMGEILPTGTYTSTKEFEADGCRDPDRRVAARSRPGHGDDRRGPRAVVRSRSPFAMPSLGR